VQTQLTAEERSWAMAAHLSALIAVAGVPFGHVIGPLVVYLVKAKESPFVAEHARASLNYQLTVSLLGLVALIVGIVVFGAWVFVAAATSSHSEGSGAAALSFVGFWVLAGIVIAGILLLSLVFIIMGSVAASSGQPYRYPFAIRFVR